MGDSYTYICDKCQNEIVTSEEAIIKCNICGNEIDTRPDSWDTKRDLNKTTRINKFWIVSFVVLISFAAFKIWVRKNRKEMEKNYSEMRGLLSPAYTDKEYQLNYSIRLEKDSVILPIFKNSNAISNLSIRHGQNKNLIVNLITYNSSDSIYSSVKSSRDTIIKNFVAVIFSKEIKDEMYRVIGNRFQSLYTQGFLSMDKQKIGFRILSDSDPQTNNNWHLIIIYDLLKENELAADELINSRQFGLEPNFVE